MTEKCFKLVEDYLIEYDGDYFDLHKPSDIRSLIKVMGYVTDENEQLKIELATYKSANALLKKTLDGVRELDDWK